MIKATTAKEPPKNMNISWIKTFRFAAKKQMTIKRPRVNAYSQKKIKNNILNFTAHEDFKNKICYHLSRFGVCISIYL